MGNTSDPELDILEQRRAFLGMRDYLLANYSDKWVAISGGKIIGSDEHEGDLYRRLHKNPPQHRVYIDKVIEDAFTKPQSEFIGPQC